MQPKTYHQISVDYNRYLLIPTDIDPQAFFNQLHDDASKIFKQRIKQHQEFIISVITKELEHATDKLGELDVAPAIDKLSQTDDLIEKSIIGDKNAKQFNPKIESIIHLLIANIQTKLIKEIHYAPEQDALFPHKEALRHSYRNYDKILAFYQEQLKLAQENPDVYLQRITQDQLKLDNVINVCLVDFIQEHEQYQSVQYIKTDQNLAVDDITFRVYDDYYDYDDYDF